MVQGNKLGEIPETVVAPNAALTYADAFLLLPYYLSDLTSLSFIVNYFPALFMASLTTIF